MHVTFITLHVTTHFYFSPVTQIYRILDQKQDIHTVHSTMFSGVAAVSCGPPTWPPEGASGSLTVAAVKCDSATSSRPPGTTENNTLYR